MAALTTVAMLLIVAQFWCPMHPDERSDARGACAICGMTLVAVPPAFATYPVDLRATPTLTGARLRVTVRHPTTRALVRRFTMLHERPMHLFVVGDGGDFFAHDYPVQQTDGVFMLDVTLPRPGPYLAVAEFLPEGGMPQTFQQVFTTSGPSLRRAAPAVDAGAKLIDGVRVAIDPSKLRSGQAASLPFTFADAGSGAPLANPESSGGGVEVLLVAADLTEAVRVHATMAPAGTVSFAPLVPRSGRYMIWLLFPRGGRMWTAPFVIDVP